MDRKILGNLQFLPITPHLQLPEFQWTEKRRKNIIPCSSSCGSKDPFCFVYWDLLLVFSTEHGQNVPKVTMLKQHQCSTSKQLMCNPPEKLMCAERCSFLLTTQLVTTYKWCLGKVYVAWFHDLVECVPWIQTFVFCWLFQVHDCWKEVKASVDRGHYMTPNKKTVQYFVRENPYTHLLFYLFDLPKMAV